MFRTYVGTGWGSLLILAAAFTALAAEKGSKETPAEAKARQEVRAALRAEASGDNQRRTEHLAAAARGAPGLAEVNWHLGRVWAVNRWLNLADEEEHANHDPQLAEYRKLRSQAEGHTNLLHGLA